jgi:hypothetical protein
LSPRPCLRPGAAIILAATLEDGAGDGPAEQRFLAAMEAEPPNKLLERVRRAGLRPGEQRAYVMGRVLLGHRVIVVCPEEGQGVVIRARMEVAGSVEEALAKVGGGRLLVLPEALLTLPCP